VTSVDVFAGEARERLRALTGSPSADFRDGQLAAIRDLVEDRARVLCVQRTGWGKSAVYFVATSLLRDEGAGPTLIISPLLALMRNQLQAAARLGLCAHTINSSNREEWDAVRDALEVDRVDLLLVSPERLNNPAFRETMLPAFAQTVGLLVVDEAHCISDWGHDFRPDYRRVRELVAALPPDTAVLGTTATANDRVVEDVVEQLGGDLRTYRGPLARASLRLEVLELPSPAARLAWLATVLPQLEGSGIVYTLTRRDAETVAEFLCAEGITALAYSGEHDTEQRIAIEQRLAGNAVKAVVATSALGMGYDKSDLAFVIHYQAPGSVIAYYQQVGRAGRGVDHAEIVLLRGAEDRRIQDFFIEQAFPARERVQAVLADLAAAGPAGRTTRELTAVVNVGLGRLEAMLKILDVEGAVARDGSRWRIVEGSPWRYDAERYTAVTALRRAEQTAMAVHGADGRCLMRALQEELDDPSAADCGRCSVCAGGRWEVPLAAELVERAGRHLRSAPVVLEPKKMAPDPGGAMRRIPDGVRVSPGLALARLGDGGWWPAIARSLAAGVVDDEVVAALADLARDVAPRWLTVVPSARHPQLLARLGEQLASTLGIPCLGLVERVRAAPPQREMSNATQQVANVRGAFRVSGRPPAGVGLLVDDRAHSGWTLAMVGGQLRRAGASQVVPFALAAL
jgi:ATP-dependent DNA helicase RecQ